MCRKRGDNFRQIFLSLRGSSPDKKCMSDEYSEEKLKSSGAIPTRSPRQPAFGREALQSWANVEPYGLCPCGSGRKFKFCCREAFNSAQPQAEWNHPALDDEPPFIAELIPHLDDEVDELLRQLESGAGK